MFVSGSFRQNLGTDPRSNLTQSPDPEPNLTPTPDPRPSLTPTPDPRQNLTPSQDGLGPNLLAHKQTKFGSKFAGEREREREVYLHPLCVSNNELEKEKTVKRARYRSTDSIPERIWPNGERSVWTLSLDQ